jgi:SAM-dependent methyltransferase
MLNQRSNRISNACLVSDAEQLSIRTASVDAILASLGDPYNTAAFWRECSRVLRPGGRVFFTTPSFEWAQAFREETEAPPMAAEFELVDGRALFVPSFVRSPTEQAALIRSAGLDVEKEVHVDGKVIQPTKRSPKLRPGAIVSGYLAKSGSAQVP